MAREINGPCQLFCPLFISVSDTSRGEIDAISQGGIATPTVVLSLRRQDIPSAERRDDSSAKLCQLGPREVSLSVWVIVVSIRESGISQIAATAQ